MSKELEETKYKLNVYARQLNKDLTNLMECLRKQDEDNKAILYEGRHLKKVILPYEEYQKMCKRLEAIENANPSESLERLYCSGNLQLDYVLSDKYKQDYKIVEQAIEELDKFKALLKKYEIKDIKALEDLITDYDDMAKALIQYTLGIEVEVKS